MPSRLRLASISAKIAFRDRPAPFGPVRIRPCTLVAITTSSRARVVEQRPADDLLAGAVGIDVGGVEEVDAEVERLLDERPALRLAERPGVVAAVGLAVAHAAEAEARDLEAGAAEAGGRHGLHGCVCQGFSTPNPSSGRDRLRTGAPRRLRQSPWRYRPRQKKRAATMATTRAVSTTGGSGWAARRPGSGPASRRPASGGRARAASIRISLSNVKRLLRSAVRERDAPSRRADRRESPTANRRSDARRPRRSRSRRSGCRSSAAGGNCARSCRREPITSRSGMAPPGGEQLRRRRPGRAGRRRRASIDAVGAVARAHG